MNSVCLRSRTEFINKDTNSLIPSSIVVPKIKQEYFRNSIYLTIFIILHLGCMASDTPSHPLGKRCVLPTMPAGLQCMWIFICLQFWTANIFTLPFMCILGLHPRDMAAILVVNPIHHFHIDHNAPSLSPKILHNHCSQFLLSITVVPREIQDNGYEKFGGGGGKQGAWWSMWKL